MEVENDKVTESLSIQPRLSYETVAAKIVKYVASRGLKPGDKLPTEQEMTEMFGVSRTVVREAIKALASNGMVRSRQGSGLYLADETQSANILPFVFTATIKPETVAQLFEFRCFMEKEIVRQAVHKITVKELRSLEKALKIHRQGAETGNREIFHQGDSMFHRVLAESTHNIFFIQSHNNLWHLLQIILEIAVGETVGSWQRAVEQHQKLFDCIKDGDEEGAVNTIEEHITSSSNPYLQAISNVMINKSYST
ncbi:MAG: FadR family transcriptional regulator [Chloroflexi bacterium]|nr:FadR family transcriptional regulator [Chloroflexota bacterium]OJV92743.1 MAG: hypothetical protein BGO39_29690 [Chloroflexi bacterium 54-19]